MCMYVHTRLQYVSKRTHDCICVNCYYVCMYACEYTVYVKIVLHFIS